jgi:hypothetical protein
MAIQERFFTPDEHARRIRARFTPAQQKRQERLDASWEAGKRHLADPEARVRIEQAMQEVPTGGMTADEFREEYRRRFGDEMPEWDTEAGAPEA